MVDWENAVVGTSVGEENTAVGGGNGVAFDDKSHTWAW